MISCLRSTGLAARYVSGYVLTRPGRARQRVAGAEASHAWVALFVPSVGWIELDPTNNVMPSGEHITLGWGRDFSDVTPLRGVINGGGKQTIEVTVAVVELDENSSIV
jgi:transglutaminase-like putative cysteine protease